MAIHGRREGRVSGAAGGGLAGLAVAVACGGVLGLGGAPAGASQTPPPFRCFDLTGDGQVTQADFDEFMRLYNEGSPLADLNLDGRLDSQDIAIAQASIEYSECAPSFRYLWSVTGENHVGQVDFGDLPVERNVAIFYQAFFGKYPARGYQEMMGSSPTNGRWRAAYEQWVTEHLDRIASNLVARIPDGSPVKYGVIDYEAAMPVWSFIANTTGTETTARRWMDWMELVNGDRIDVDLVAFSSHRLPQGVQRWSDLSVAERDRFAGAAWDAIGRDFFERTFDQLREVRPDVKWGMYNMPKGLLNTPINGRARARGDEFGWLIGMMDFLAPSLYRAPYVDRRQEASSCSSSSSTRLVEWYETNVTEMIRLRDAHAPGKPILPYVWLHYHPGMNCVGSKSPKPIVSEENLRAMLMLPKLYGADGVFIWHNFYAPHHNRDWATKSQVEHDMHERWRPVVKRFGGARNAQDDQDMDGGGAGRDDGSSKPSSDGGTLHRSGGGSGSGSSSSSSGSGGSDGSSGSGSNPPASDNGDKDAPAPGDDGSGLGGSGSSGSGSGGSSSGGGSADSGGGSGAGGSGTADSGSALASGGGGTVTVSGESTPARNVASGGGGGGIARRGGASGGGGGGGGGAGALRSFGGAAGGGGRGAGVGTISGGGVSGSGFILLDSERTSDGDGEAADRPSNEQRVSLPRHDLRAVREALARAMQRH